MNIRPLEPADVEHVVALSLRAWKPVFSSIRDAIGPGLYAAFYPEGWEASQEAAVAAVCTDGEHEVGVAVENGVPVGFVALKLPEEGDLGEIYMIAVDPEHQGGGVGGHLTQWAEDRFRAAGLTIAMVETGADPGHAPARRLYERMGFELVPAARYFKRLR